MTDHDEVPDRAADDDIVRAGGLLRNAMPVASFSDGFADRTMARLAAARVAIPPAVLRVAAMQRSFRLLAAAAAIAIVALGVHNTVIARGDNTSIMEAAIGLQPVSAESVLSYTSEALQ
ncbi:MAG: hypothetical protein H7099_03495 [Gemmatimonadaceae bacterium]|nr:hypothetical protein [Gemmatimonadaceae bacterium]